MTAHAIILAIQLSYLLTVVLALALAGWVAARQGDRGPAVRATVCALVLTACWAVSDFILGSLNTVTVTLLSLNYLAWLWMVYRLFGVDVREGSAGPVRMVVLALALVEMLQIALALASVSLDGGAITDGLLLRFTFSFRLLFCVGALVLVHNLYVGATPQARDALRWPAASLALLWLYDLNLSTIAYLGESTPRLLVSLRTAVVLVSVTLLALGAARRGANLRFRPSRSFAFQSFSLLVIGGYLLVMDLIAQSMAHAWIDWAEVVQAGVLVLACIVAIVALSSRRLRSVLRVTLIKNLFQHRYDYRAEWLRFTDTIGRAGASAPPLRERIIQAVADITDSPSGLLLTPREDGFLTLDTRWQWDAIDVPPDAIDLDAQRFFEDNHFILDLDEIRAGRNSTVPPTAQPDWLMEHDDAWALVPLLHYGRLVGVIVLSRPPAARLLDWEDFDLLRVVGRQLASYLAEQASQDALSESQRFDEFNRRIAFVMHDIKNLASQLSLLATNAEKHAEKPEFREDMLITLRNSADKLQALLARLGRYGAHGSERSAPVALRDVLQGIARRYRGQGNVVVPDRPACLVMADVEALDQAMVHLVQNALEASPEGSSIYLDYRIDDDRAVVEVIDTGTGMSNEFVRTRLFKPFHSSKPGGFGIGAFEARELIRAMGGRLDVESREGVGTRFILRIPLAESQLDTATRSARQNSAEVA